MELPTMWPATASYLLTSAAVATLVAFSSPVEAAPCRSLDDLPKAAHASFTRHLEGHKGQKCWLVSKPHTKPAKVKPAPPNIVQVPTDAVAEADKTQDIPPWPADRGAAFSAANLPDFYPDSDFDYTWSRVVATDLRIRYELNQLPQAIAEPEETVFGGLSRVVKLLVESAVAVVLPATTAQPQQRKIIMVDKSWWISWVHKVDTYSQYTLTWPWWITNQDTKGANTVCAAVRAPSEGAAKEIVIRAYDKPPLGVFWRFCQQQSDDWTPFKERFPRAEWMQWPTPAAAPAPSTHV